MEKKIFVQRLRQSFEDRYLLAERYYLILCAVNNIKLTEREIQLIAFTAIHGNMSYANVREDFCKKYETSSPTINNMISRLKKLGILVKDNGKIKVHPAVCLKFDNDIVLNITLSHGQTS